MKLNQPVTDIIKIRTSRRKYQKKEISFAHRKAISEFINTHSKGPFGSKTRFDLVVSVDGDAAALKGLGTYGFIKNPPGFIIGAVSNYPRNLEDFGYSMENIILKATDLGLGTCWLGGSFNSSEFSKKINASQNELVPAVVAIGYATDQAGTLERFIQWGAKARKRYGWETLFFERDFFAPLKEKKAGRFAKPLEMVRIAPSASNKQPWRFVMENPSLIHLYLQRTEGYDKQIKFFKLADIQRIDMGIAMSHLEATFREEGIEGQWVIEDPTTVGSLPERTEYIASFQI